MLAKVIENCIERKMEEFDFMKGDKLYKFTYTVMTRRNWNIQFVNNKSSTTSMNGE
jgi:hypothetical protein